MIATTKIILNVVCTHAYFTKNLFRRRHTQFLSSSLYLYSKFLSLSCSTRAVRRFKKKTPQIRFFFLAVGEIAIVRNDKVNETSVEYENNKNIPVICYFGQNTVLDSNALCCCSTANYASIAVICRSVVFTFFVYFF